MDTPDTKFILLRYLETLSAQSRQKSLRRYCAWRKRRKSTREAENASRQYFENGWIPVYSVVLQRIFGKRYAEMLRTLESEGWIKRDRRFSVKKHLCSRIKVMRVQHRGSLPGACPVLPRLRLLLGKQPVFRPRWLPPEKTRLWARICKAFRGTLLRDTELERLGLSGRSSRTRGGRRNDALGNLKKEDRHRLRWDGKRPVVEVDATACFWQIIARIAPGGERLLAFLASRQDIYLGLAPGVTRDDAKEQSWQYLFGGGMTLWGRAFASRFVRAHRWLQSMRARLGDTELSHFLTRHESCVMEAVVVEMRSRGHNAVRLHDAILTDEDGEMDAWLLMGREFSKLKRVQSPKSTKQ